MKRLKKHQKKAMAATLPDREIHDFLREWSGWMIKNRHDVQALEEAVDNLRELDFQTRRAVSPDASYRLVLTTNSSPPPMAKIPHPPFRKKERFYTREKNWARKRRRYRRHLRYDAKNSFFSRMKYLFV